MSENLPALITRAAQALAKATTAAQLLEARKLAKVGYDAAKLAARLTEAKGAHDQIVAACRKAMADALMIETRAQCRLAEEYDVAQERGEVHRHGGQGKRDVPNKNIPSTVTEVGLTRKQIYEARVVRDAEKKKPGIVQITIDAHLAAGKEPTRAIVKRAIHDVINPKNIKPKPPRSEVQLERDDRNAKIIALADGGWSADAISKEFDLTERVVHRILEVEQARRKGPAALIEPLSKKAEDRFAAAMRQGKRKLEAEFDLRLREEVRKRLEDTILPSYNKSYAEHQEVIKTRKGILTKAQYRNFLFCVHPDRVQHLKDATLSKRFRDAYDLLNQLEKRLLDEKESPTDFPPMPSTYNELMKARQEVMARRRAQREASKTALRRR